MRPALSGAVLVAGDGGEASNGAIRLGELLARRDRVNVHVLGIMRSLGFPISAFANVDTEALEAGRRAQLLDRLRRRVHQTVGRSVLFSLDAATGSPARLLAAAARERNSACVLVGIADRDTPERAAGEDEVLQIASIAAVPVIAVPADRDRLPTHALVALDFGDSSRRAAATAMQLLAPNGTLTLMHVEPEADLRAFGHDGLAEIYENGVAALFANLAAEIEEASDASVETILLKGDPVTALPAAIDSAPYDLIACGTQGVSALDRNFAGSVSTALLRASSATVLIAPPTSEEPAA
ncbi:MAG TPA: universal stress protein [Gemmatimonadaceae bacterium]|jgi:nucleotide-binding universal stress UspA family protein